MASIVEFSSIPRVHCTNILPGKRPDRVASGREMLPKRYEALARLSRTLAAGTPEDWIRDLSADLRGMLPFDLLDVVVYKKDENEIDNVCPKSIDCAPCRFSGDHLDRVARQVSKVGGWTLSVLGPGGAGG
jgi:hypothetical protein